MTLPQVAVKWITHFLISTKVGRLLEPRPHRQARDDEGFDVPGDTIRRWDFSPEGIERSLQESLARLQLKSVDILFAHDPDLAPGNPTRESLTALADLKSAGVISAIGVGTNSVNGLAALIDDGLVDVVMLANRYSLLDQSGLDAVLNPALRAGVSVICAGVFATGLLSTPRPDYAATYEYRPADAKVVNRALRIASICDDHGLSLPAAALAFPQQHPAVVGVAVGMRSSAEVDEDADNYNTDIPAALWDDLASEGLIPAQSIPLQTGPTARPTGR